MLITLFFLRYDDTNPEAEKEEYIDHIKEIVEWMGWKPFKVGSLKGINQFLCLKAHFFKKIFCLLGFLDHLCKRLLPRVV